MDSAYLEVGIGLAVVFFVVTTLADGLNEVVTRALNTRSKALWATMHGLLEEQIDQRPRIGTSFIATAALPWWIARRIPFLDLDRRFGDGDFRPVVGQAELDASRAARDWLTNRFKTLDKTERADVADRIREFTGKKLWLVRRALKRIDDLGYDRLLELAAMVGIDVEASTLYPALDVEANRRRLSVHLRHELDRDTVANWAITQDDPATVLAGALPMTAARRRLLVESVADETDRKRIERAGATLAWRFALDDKTPDEQARLVIDAGGGEGGEELTRRWMADTRQPTESEETVAAWLVAQPAARQLDLLGRTTVTGRTGDAVARTAQLLAMASIEGLDYVRRRGRKTKVWWIDGRAFGSAIWEVAKRYDPDPDDGPLDVNSAARVAAIAAEWQGTPLGDYLRTTGVDHATDVDRFVEAMGSWFDGQMDRLSLIYRRNVKWVLGLIGLVMAVGFNVNAVALTDALLDDAGARQTLTSYADDLVERCGDEAEAEQENCFATIDDKLDGISRLDELGIPLVSERWIMPFVDDEWGETNDGFWGWSLWGLGIGVTSIAVSQGGTFWFDFLKLLTGVRRRR